MAWHIAPSLVNLKNELNIKWPNRDKSSDGSIGDASHSSRDSDHNPNSRESVDAIDIDVDGIDKTAVINAAIKHPSTNYVINDRRIWQNGKWTAYTGTNPHTQHIHVSIKQTKAAEDNSTKWLSNGSGVVPVTPGVQGPSLVDYMKSRGMDSSFNNRARLAALYGISGYSRTADQNIRLLGLLKAVTSPVVKPTVPQAVAWSVIAKGNVNVRSSKSTSNSSNIVKKVMAPYFFDGYDEGEWVRSTRGNYIRKTELNGNQILKRV